MPIFSAPPPSTANYPGSLPSITPELHKNVNDELVAVATELDNHKANGTAHSAEIATAVAAAVAGISSGSLGTLGYAEHTAYSTGAIVSGSSDLLSRTVTVGAGRRIRIRGHLPNVIGTSATSIVLAVREGTTQLGSAKWAPVAGLIRPMDVEAIIQPTAGAHTYLITLITAGGTPGASIFDDPTSPSFIHVEDVGV